jgi:hypothetical protein
MSGDAEQLITLLVGEHTDSPVAAPHTAAEQWPADPVCEGAVDLARDALVEEAGESAVGEHRATVTEGPHVVTHFFDGLLAGYAGWQWAVTVSRTPDSDHVTIDETALLPEAGALLAPPWVPWKKRILSGDLGAGDVMVTEPGDPRLVAGMADNDLPDPDADSDLQPPQWELGLGRPRILSPVGRREAAQRWYRDAGPRAAAARAADLTCSTCGFLVLIGGPLGQAFGLCANGYSPADGRAVALDYGCGAHSETVEAAAPAISEPVVDETGYLAIDEDSDAVESPGPGSSAQTGESPGGEPVADVGADPEPSADPPAAAEAGAPAPAQPPGGTGAVPAAAEDSGIATHRRSPESDAEADAGHGTMHAADAQEDA